MTRLHYRREPISRRTIRSRARRSPGTAVFRYSRRLTAPTGLYRYPSASAARRVTVHYFISRFVAPADRSC